MPRRTKNNGSRLDALIDTLGPKALARVAAENTRRVLDAVYSDAPVDDGDAKRIGRRASDLGEGYRDYVERHDATEAAQLAAVIAAPNVVALRVAAMAAQDGAAGWGALAGFLDLLDAQLRPAMADDTVAAVDETTLQGVRELLQTLDHVRAVATEHQADLEKLAAAVIRQATDTAAGALQKREDAQRTLGGLDPLPAVLLEGLELAEQPAPDVRPSAGVQETSVSCTEDVDGDGQ